MTYQPMFGVAETSGIHFVTLLPFFEDCSSYIEIVTEHF